MKVADFKRFIFENKIKQSFLADFLGVSAGYISSVVSGRKELSEENFGKVVNNPYGWDISMLCLDDLSEAQIKKVDETLVAYLQGKIEDKDKLIQELYKQIGMLEAKLDLARKGESVASATGSSVVNAG